MKNLAILALAAISLSYVSGTRIKVVFVYDVDLAFFFIIL